MSRSRRDTRGAAVPTAPAVVADAKPYHGGDGRVGVLFCHGFTGSPRSLIDWAKATEAAGFRVALPRLPGHGTVWQEMNQTTWHDWYAALDRELSVLLDQCDTVFVAGLSMGGGLALVLAEDHGDAIAGLALVNPSVGSADKTMRLVPLLKRLRASMPGIASDIKKPQTLEGGYDRTPLRAVASLMDLWRHVSGRLGEITQPIMLFRSVTDHVVDPSSAATILASVASTDVTERLLAHSYHVATMDNDAELIFAESIAFFERVLASRAELLAPGTGEGAR